MLVDGLEIRTKLLPPLDSGFASAALWNREFSRLAKSHGSESTRLVVALERPNGCVSTVETQLLPDRPEWRKANLLRVERLVKFMLWMRGGRRVILAGGTPGMAAELSVIYSKVGARAFDDDLLGRRIYGAPLVFEERPLSAAPHSKELSIPLGGHLKGCRVGFDLGGSDRKCAAVIDGEVVFSEEIKWDPYFQKDPSWHKAGIVESIKLAAGHMPRLDAIGGSSAGVFVDNEARVASLFRGVSEADFDRSVRGMFKEIGREFAVPMEVVNDGEVTALAGSMSSGRKCVLGISMGTSMAGGYTTPEGKITDWLNEIAFAPVDYRHDAPLDEWSGDRGCGVQYFSQQGVARLAGLAGIEFHDSKPLAERLSDVQSMLASGDARARRVYESIGVCFGHAVAHYSDFYDVSNLLILGRVTSGEGGSIILSKAGETLASEFPDIAGKVDFLSLDEKGKRHGQAVAAASLPSI